MGKERGLLLYPPTAPPSWPGLTRPSRPPSGKRNRRWIPGSSPGMTAVGGCKSGHEGRSRGDDDAVRWTCPAQRFNKQSDIPGGGRNPVNDAGGSEARCVDIAGLPQCPEPALTDYWIPACAGMTLCSWNGKVRVALSMDPAEWPSCAPLHRHGRAFSIWPPLTGLPATLSPEGRGFCLRHRGVIPRPLHSHGRA